MPERSYTAHMSLKGSNERKSFTIATATILCALVLAVTLLRFYRLSALPPGINSGEAANAMDALDVLQGDHAVFFSEKVEGREGMVVYAMAVSIALLGRTELALHLPLSLASSATVFLVFWLGLVLFGKDAAGRWTTRWRGLLIGGVAAGLLAVSLGQTIIGRTAYRPPLFPLFLVPCMLFLWEGWTLRSRWRVAMAGVCAGLLPYTYIPARFTPFLFALFGLSFVLSLRRSEGGVKGLIPSIATPRVRTELSLASTIVVVALLVAAPILLYFALNPENFVSRSGRLSVFDPAFSPSGPLHAFLSNAWYHLLAFGFRGDPFWRHNFAEQPMLNLWEAFFFWLGVGIAARHWQRPAYRLLLLWLVVLMAPALLSTDRSVGYEGPNTLRIIGAAPAVYLIIGLSIWETFCFLKERFPGLGLRRGFSLLGNRIEPAVLVPAFVVGLVVTQGIFTFRTYFQDWAGSPEVFAAYHQEWTDLARVLNAEARASDEVYLLPYNDADRPFGFDYLYQGAAPAHVVVATTPHNLAQKIKSTLANEEAFSAIHYVDWNDDYILIENGDEHLSAVLSKYARYLGNVQYPSFRIHSYADVDLTHLWTLYDSLEPLTVHYDGGISLMGIALGQGTDQLSTLQIPKLEESHSLWLALQWQVSPELDNDYSASLRLHDDSGAPVFQKDIVLKDAHPAPTSRWTAEEPVDTLFYLSPPANLAPGEYELRLLVYDFETLKPTVELGVWEPEKVLARLRLDGAE